MKRRCFLGAGLVATSIAALPAYANQHGLAGAYGLHRKANALANSSVTSGESIALWPSGPPGGGGPEGSEVWSHGGSLRNISTPAIRLYRPARPNGAAMLIAAGGGYRHIEMGKEAEPAALWLNKLGITALVLSYRLPQEGWNAGRMAPFQDAQRALRMIRARASQWRLDPKRMGVLGFSAGAHLLGMCAVRPQWSTYPPMDSIDRFAADSALNLLIYPIVTLQRPYQHTSTCKVILGSDTSAIDAADWSIQNHVGANDAPFFLVQANDDPVSDPANTAILAQVCRQHGVAVVRHLFPSGGHGFGMGRQGTETTEWPAMAEQWMRQQRFI